MRGGRSNFGVVTELEIGLFPVTSFYGGGLYYPAEDIEAVIRAYFSVVRDAPDALTCSLAVLNLPPVPEVPEPMRGKSFAHVRITHLGPDDEAEKLVLPFRAIGSAAVDTIGRHPYAEFAAVHTDPTDRFPYEEQGITVTDLPDKAIDVLVREARQTSGSPVTALEIRHLGGALVRRPGEAAPVAVWDAVFSVWGVTAGPPEVVDAGMAVLDDTLRQLTPWSTGYVYTNFAGRDDRAEDVFTAEDLQRLRALKEVYDPLQPLQGEQPQHHSGIGPRITPQ
ncbi:hypothetical protein [Streptomyces sp. NPDC050988]|uniref:hypothetical protein n=1 Tax=Streptomyces sp. NPDC050988 TaxID=3365637 RepID=UPI0037A1CD48